MNLDEIEARARATLRLECAPRNDHAIAADVHALVAEVRAARERNRLLEAVSAALPLCGYWIDDNTECPRVAVVSSIQRGGGSRERCDKHVRAEDRGQVWTTDLPYAAALRALDAAGKEGA